MKKPLAAVLIVGIVTLTACHASTTRQTPPTQVVYRFYDHR